MRLPRTSAIEAQQPGAAATGPAGEPAQEQHPFDDEMHAKVQAREPVAIDPTVDRTLIRQQIQALKDRGYRFDSIQKLWIAN